MKKNFMPLDKILLKGSDCAVRSLRSVSLGKKRLEKCKIALHWEKDFMCAPLVKERKTVEVIALPGVSAPKKRNHSERDMREEKTE